MEEPSKLTRNYWLVLAILGLATIWLALDAKHYWHEMRFLYATTHFSMNEILSGEFNPHQFGGKIDEIGAGGFYLTKVATLWYLKQLFRWIPPDRGGFLVSVYLSVFLMGASGAITYKIFHTLFEDGYHAFLAVCCYLLVPITPYLSGKILSEVPAFFFMTACILFFDKGARSDKPVSWPYITLSGLFLLGAGLSRLDMTICFFSYVGALLAFSEKEHRYKIVLTGSIASSIFLAGEVVTIYSLGKDFQYFTKYLVGFLSVGQKSRLMSLLGILTFGGVAYILAFSALLARRNKEISLLVTWFSLATGMEILLTWGWMVEPRYLVPGLLPLIGLASIGLRGMMAAIAEKKSRYVYVGIGIVIATMANAATIRMMPYELDRDSIQKAVNTIHSIDTASAILVPWFYTDFHFLRVMFPDSNVINVHSSRRKNNDNAEQEWEDRLRKWYGPAYARSPATVNALLRRGSVYYLGWEKYPPVEDAKRVTSALNLKRIQQYIDRLPLINHLTQSWIWRFPAYRFDLIGSCGMYKYYRITKIEQAARHDGY